MSFDAGGARGSTGSGGGGPRGSAGSGAPGMAEPRKTGDARGSVGDGAEGGGPRGSGASGGRPRGSTGEPGAGAGETRGSVGSAGGGRVSFQGGDEGAPKDPRGSRGSAAGRYPGEVVGELDYYRSQEMHGEDCSCEDCVCPADEEEEQEAVVTPPTPDDVETYQLDEFMRAKSYFQQISAKSGLSMYDHLSEVIRKFLDERAPNNPVDYLEEVSMNVKRYRFGLKKEDILQDTFFISDGVQRDAQRIFNYFRQFALWSVEKKETPGESDILPGGSFQNLLRLQYYSEQVNIGLTREEMYRAALGIKELSGSRSQIGKLRFWGKIWGTQRNYFVVEAELKFGGSDQAMDMWNPKDEEGNEIPLERRRSEGSAKSLELDAVQTFGRAKDVVFNHEFLQAYSKSSGLPPEKQAALLPTVQLGSYQPWEGEGAPGDYQGISLEDTGERSDAMKWEAYQQELMQNFPQAKILQQIQVPPESDGSGVNRRVFYVCNELGEDWALLPPVTPQQINASRNIRWFLTGNLDSPVKSIPTFPGKEGHYLKALLVRITAGGMCSPKGYYRSRPSEEIPGEEDDEELGGEDGEPPRAGNDAVTPVKKYNASMKALTDPNLSFWVHHTSYILQQGRATWWNPAAAKQKRRGTSEYDSEMEGSEYEEDEEDDEDMLVSGKEVGPPLFQSVAEDKANDRTGPWSLITSSSVFPEFQVVSVRSNVWTGSFGLCTCKGKVANLYFGDGLKFAPISFVPQFAGVPMKEFKGGPELEETLDPTMETEQNWLNKLALQEAEENKLAEGGGITTGDEDGEGSDFE